jgi:hypothetical protein
MRKKLPNSLLPLVGWGDSMYEFSVDDPVGVASRERIDEHMVDGKTYKAAVYAVEGLDDGIRFSTNHYNKILKPDKNATKSY